MFRLKKNSRVTLTPNVDIDDCLVNGQLGTIVDTREDSSGILSAIYVKFEDQNAGLMKMRSGKYVSENNIVPILRTEATFSVSLNSRPAIHRTVSSNASICMYSSQSVRLDTTQHCSFFQFK